jgi:hypothetical protein
MGNLVGDRDGKSSQAEAGCVKWETTGARVIGIRAIGKVLSAEA